MEKRYGLRVVSVAIVSVLFFAQSMDAYAWQMRRDDHRKPVRHYPSRGNYEFWLGAAVTSLILGGTKYYYSKGVYYRKNLYGYIVVNPPCGAVVSTIPQYYEPIVMGGVTYYTSDGIYYRREPYGYVVIEEPKKAVLNKLPSATVCQPSSPLVVSKVIPKVPAGVGEKTFTINVPNGSGDGYTGVTLRESEHGYIGPQGEFYSEFPSVDQLKAMYGKK